jgi:uncharacterized protein
MACESRTQMAERLLAVITGASSGIGAVFARKLAARNYDLLLIARREDRLRALALELAEEYRVSAEPLAADLLLDADLERVAARIRTAPNLGLLVNNAGFGALGYFFETDLASQQQMHRLHVLATVQLTHAALTNLVARGTGGVINVASVAGFGQSPGSVSYSATKTWMNSFTEGLYMELKSAGSPVQVQALCPGFTLSEFHDTMPFDRKQIPAWMWMSTDEVVDTSLRALSGGQLLVVPGWRYRLLVAAMRAFPRSIYHALAIKYARGTGRDR